MIYYSQREAQEASGENVNESSVISNIFSPEENVEEEIYESSDPEPPVDGISCGLASSSAALVRDMVINSSVSWWNVFKLNFILTFVNKIRIFYDR